MRGQPKLIKRNDSDNWFIYVPKKGKQRAQRLNTGETDDRQAELIFAQWLLERRKPELAPLEEIRVIDMLERYAEHKKDDATVDYHMRHLRPYFKNMAVSHVSNHTMRAYATHRASQTVRRGKRDGDKKVSPATIRRELDTFSAAMGYAHREGYIAAAPYIEKPQASLPRERWFTVEEYARLLAACERHYLQAFVEISMATEARPSSVLELKWFQIDLNERLIHFNPPDRRQTKKYRPTVYINDMLLPVLTKLREDTKSEYVISRKNGKRVESIKKAFAAACRRAGLIGVTPYTLRHTSITWAIQGGESLARAGQVAGHKEPRTTARYAKHDPNATKGTTQILAAGAQLAHKMAENIKNEQKPAEKMVKKQ